MPNGEEGPEISRFRPPEIPGAEEGEKEPLAPGYYPGALEVLRRAERLGAPELRYFTRGVMAKLEDDPFKKPEQFEYYTATSIRSFFAYGPLSTELQSMELERGLSELRGRVAEEGLAPDEKRELEEREKKLKEQKANLERRENEVIPEEKRLEKEIEIRIKLRQALMQRFQLSSDQSKGSKLFLEPGRVIMEAPEIALLTRLPETRKGEMALGRKIDRALRGATTWLQGRAEDEEGTIPNFFAFNDEFTANNVGRARKFIGSREGVEDDPNAIRLALDFACLWEITTRYGRGTEVTVRLGKGDQERTEKIRFINSDYIDGTGTREERLKREKQEIERRVQELLAEEEDEGWTEIRDRRTSRIALGDPPWVNDIYRYYFVEDKRAIEAGRRIENVDGREWKHKDYFRGGKVGGGTIEETVSRETQYKAGPEATLGQYPDWLHEDYLHYAEVGGKSLWEHWWVDGVELGDLPWEAIPEKKIGVDVKGKIVEVGVNSMDGELYGRWRSGNTYEILMGEMDIAGRDGIDEKGGFKKINKDLDKAGWTKGKFPPERDPRNWILIGIISEHHPERKELPAMTGKAPENQIRRYGMSHAEISERKSVPNIEDDLILPAIRSGWSTKEDIRFIFGYCGLSLKKKIGPFTYRV